MDFVKQLASAKARQAAQDLATYSSIASGESRPAERFSFTRLLSSCAMGGVTGYEAEVCEEAARRAGRAHDANRPIVPWSAFTRASPDERVSVASQGGYLVETEVSDALDVLRPYAAVARAGMSVISGLVGNITVPRTKTTSTGYWLPLESTAITQSGVVLGSIGMSPKMCGDFTEVSRQLLKQSAQAEGFVSRELLKTVGVLIDQAVLNGTGTSGQPQGLLQTPSIGTQSGTSLTYDGVLAMQQAAAEANADDADLAAIATPAVRRLLSARERATGSGFIWDDGEIADMPSLVTTSMPTATMVIGAWPQVVLGLWGPGLQIEQNPFDPTGFQKGIVQFRVLVACDVAIRYPAAFVAATSIT